MKTAEERLKSITNKCLKGYISNSDYDKMLIGEMQEYANEQNADLLEACEWLLENYGVPYDIETTTKVLEAKEVKMLDKIELIINKAKMG